MYKFIALIVITLVMIASCVNQPVKDDQPTKNDEPVQTPEDTLFKWESTGILINPKSDDTHNVVSIKDPTVVFYEGKWHIYATIFNKRNNLYNMVYLNFSDWSEADSATLYYMDSNPDLGGYKCAPQVFYFEPQKTWYLIYQSQPPTYSTATELGGPSNWSGPEYFYSGKPKGAPNLWIDFWIICDSENAYMFFSGDNGELYRSQTTVEDFPEGFGEVATIMSYPKSGDLFEACNVYKIEGHDRYLLLNECFLSGRYFKAFISDSLDGTWYELATDFNNPFCGLKNVTFPDGVKKWPGGDFSHGEILRAGYDQTLTIEDRDLRFLYQGRTGSGANYNLTPWSLGILNQVSDPGAESIFDVDLGSLTVYVNPLDALKIEGSEGDSNVLVVELEDLSDQKLFPPLSVKKDSTASGGKVIGMLATDNEYLAAASDSEKGQVVISFKLSEKANMEFQISAKMPSPSDDSFYYKLDKEPWEIQNNYSTGEYDTITPKIYTDLSAGKHTLKILRREDGALLDKVTLKVSAGTISIE